MMIAEGLTYPRALELIDLLKAENIDANITVGGVSINPKFSQVEIAKKVCRFVGAAVIEGNRSALAEMTIQRLRSENE